MKICFVYQSDYPWDVRVEKLIKSISGRGHQVFLVCRNMKRRTLREVSDGINMRRLPFLPAMPISINKIISIPFYINPVWIFHIMQCVRKDKCDVIIIRDLPLLLMGIVVAKLLRKQIIYDMAECYPNMYQSMLMLENNKIVNFLLKNHYIASIVEFIAIHNVDNIIVMIEESRERLLAKGVDQDKILIIKNTPSIKDQLGKSKKYEEKKTLRLLYVGFVTRLRGIEFAIEGLNYYYNHIVSDIRVEFNVIGIGPALGYLEGLINKYKLDKYVNLLGWCSHGVVEEFYKDSDVGVLTYPQCSHWNSTIPNKLFDYMAMGMPIIASEVKPIKRIIDDVGCGVTINPDNPKTFSTCLLKMLDCDYRNQLGIRGIEAIKNKYNWENDIKKLWKIL